MTRSVTTEKAKDLAKLGAEVVPADLDDVESVKRAFQGAYSLLMAKRADKLRLNGWDNNSGNWSKKETH
jgi:uncharacterized protein YbjT (DUF2867 family)